MTFENSKLEINSLRHNCELIDYAYDHNHKLHLVYCRTSNRKKRSSDDLATFHVINYIFRHNNDLLDFVMELL